MKLLITAIVLMFSFNAFAEIKKQHRQRTMEDVLKMNESEFRAVTKKELSEIPAELIPVACMQIGMAKQMATQTCKQNAPIMKPEDKKLCIKIVTLANISSEECALKMRELKGNK